MSVSFCRIDSAVKTFTKAFGPSSSTRISRLIGTPHHCPKLTTIMLSRLTLHRCRLKRTVPVTSYSLLKNPPSLLTHIAPPCHPRLRWLKFWPRLRSHWMGWSMHCSVSGAQRLVCARALRTSRAASAPWTHRAAWYGRRLARVLKCKHAYPLAFKRLCLWRVSSRGNSRHLVAHEDKRFRFCNTWSSRQPPAPTMTAGTRRSLRRHAKPPFTSFLQS
jgi:hypothetical protein